MSKQVEDEAVKVESSNNEVKQYFINDDKFQLLRQCQQLIFEATEVSPAIRKLVNELISAENLEKVRVKFVNQWKQ